MLSEVASNSKLDDCIWRAVEAQHRVSTMRLVDNDTRAQAILENLIETAKPPLPTAAQSLHWLLAAPFRYPPLAHGSRFRGHDDAGVFYGALERRTACAESGYWRWRFVKDSRGLSGLASFPMTVFDAKVEGSAIDLRFQPYDIDREKWISRDDYSHTQALAKIARFNDIDTIIYESVRDPEQGTCVAVLTPTALASGREPRAETWFLTVTKQRTIWQRGHELTFEFFWSE